MLQHSVCFAMAFFGGPDRSITVVKPACNESVDESLFISLSEKQQHLGNVPQVVKIYFGHIPNVRFEIEFRM